MTDPVNGGKTDFQGYSSHNFTAVPFALSGRTNKTILVHDATGADCMIYNKGPEQVTVRRDGGGIAWSTALPAGNGVLVGNVKQNEVVSLEKPNAGDAEGWFKIN